MTLFLGLMVVTGVIVWIGVLTTILLVYLEK